MLIGRRKKNVAIYGIEPKVNRNINKISFGQAVNGHIMRGKLLS